MNRQKFLDRDFASEGTDRAKTLALALSEICDPEFLETLLHLKGALDEFGGQVYIAATRDRLRADESGNLVKAEDGGGEFLTYGYIAHYGSKPTLNRLQTEEESPEVEAPPDTDTETSSNGAEPVEEPAEA